MKKKASKYSVIGGFFFLRSLSPVIVSPENFDIINGKYIYNILLTIFYREYFN